jgi:hypothetical protein
MQYGQNTTFQLSEKIIDSILKGATPTQVAGLIDHYIAPLEHHKDSTVGLWATDQEGLWGTDQDMTADKDIAFFRIEF